MPVLGSRCHSYVIHAPTPAILPRRVAFSQHKFGIRSKGYVLEAQQLSSAASTRCTIGKRISCSAQSSSAMNGDIEFINPPREGKLESTNLPGNVRKQVGLSLPEADLHYSTAAVSASIDCQCRSRKGRLMGAKVNSGRGR
jgi:hypothetical protein